MAKRGRRAKNRARIAKLERDCAVARREPSGKRYGAKGAKAKRERHPVPVGGALTMPPREPREVLPVALFKIKGCTLWAGDRAARKGDWKAIVALGESESFVRESFRTSNGAEGVFPLATDRARRSIGTPELYVDWNDYEAPPEHVTARFWIDLLRDFGALKGDVLVHCMGGHGRTGTAIAALAHLSPVAGFDQIIPQGDCAIAWTRANYSKRAVESLGQGNYLKGLGAHISPDTLEALGPALQSWRHAYEGDVWPTTGPTSATGTPGTTGTSAYGAHAGAGWWSAAKDAQRKQDYLDDEVKFCAMCGLEILEKRPITTHEADGSLWYFCSEECLDNGARPGDTIQRDGQPDEAWMEGTAYEPGERSVFSAADEPGTSASTSITKLKVGLQ